MDDIDAECQYNIAKYMGDNDLIVHMNYLPFSILRCYNFHHNILGCDYLPLNMIAASVRFNKTDHINCSNLPPRIRQVQLYEQDMHAQGLNLYYIYGPMRDHHYLYYNIYTRKHIALRASLDYTIAICLDW
jgi:hypothetical protein